MTTDAQWQRLDRHLDELLELEATAREARLAEIGLTDPVLARKLARMIANVASTDPLEDMGSSMLFQEAVASLEGLAPGDQLGGWTLQRRCGSGGMADVFEASRVIGDAVQRAAIKVMAVGLGSEEQRRRFRQETAILARLEDPRLSRLIDAGASPAGLPWLAMEYIDGQPIDSACDELRLGLKARVRMMIEVAQVVDYCHRELIVHRDLKPSNIFVTAKGRVRLLDFGIAKVQEVAPLDPQQTATLSPAFTVQFTSPEQLSGRTAGIASDVYQLGLVLYLLVTGQRAFARFEHNPLELIRAMRAGPALPSALPRAQTGAETGANAPRARRRRWVRALRGDLDAVVMRALEAEPEARYRGAREFAEDLQRWLDGVPVTARSHTPWFRAARYLRRHWVGAGAVAAIFLLVSSYAVTATWQSKRLARERNVAEQARVRAEAMRDFLLQVFGSVDPMSQTSRGKTVEQLLIEGAERARTEFPDQPLLAAQLLMDMGDVLLRRGKLQEARMAYEEALTLRQRELGPEHPETLETVPDLGRAQYRLGEGQEALELLSGHAERVERALGAPSAPLVEALLALAAVESVYGDIAAAEDQIRRALDLQLALHPEGAAGSEERLRQADIEHQMAVVLLRAGKYEEAAGVLAGSLARFETEAGRLDVRTLDARKNLGFAYRMLLRPEEARAVFEETLSDERELYDGAHWQIAYTIGHIANLASDAKRYDEAVELWKEAEEETRAALGDDYIWIESARYGQGRCLVLGGRLEEGLPILQELVESGRDRAMAERARSLLERYASPERTVSSDAGS